MEVANVRLRLNKLGSDVPIRDVTPAEAMLLHILHGNNCGGMTFGEEMSKIDIVGTAKVVVKPAIPEEREPDVVIPELPQIGMPGKPGYRAASPARRQEGKLISAAVPAVLRDRTDREELTRLVSKYQGARDKTNKPIINTVWPDRFNPKLPQTFKEVVWAEVTAAAAGIETAAVNYATGAPATTGTVAGDTNKIIGS